MIKKIINNELLRNIIINNWKDNKFRLVFHNSILSTNVIRIKRNNIDLAFLFIGNSIKNNRSLILKINIAEINVDDLSEIIGAIQYITNYHEVIPNFTQVDNLKYKNLEKQNWNNFRIFYEESRFEEVMNDDIDFFNHIYHQFIETFQYDEYRENEYKITFEECLITENFNFIVEENGGIILILIGEKVKNDYLYLLISVLENLLDEKYIYTINVDLKTGLPDFRLTEKKKETIKNQLNKYEVLYLR